MEGGMAEKKKGGKKSGIKKKAIGDGSAEEIIAVCSVHWHDFPLILTLIYSTWKKISRMRYRHQVGHYDWLLLKTCSGNITQR
jgi:hypothetical protein